MIKYEISRLKKEEGCLTLNDLKRLYIQYKSGEDIEIHEGLTFDKEDVLTFITSLNELTSDSKIKTNNTKFIKLLNSFIRSQVNKRVLVIDNHNFFHRTFHSVPAMVDNKGRQVSVLKSLSNLLKWLINTQDRYTHIIFSSEGGNLKRKEQTISDEKSYKGNRKETDPSLRQQIKLCESFLEDVGFSVIRRAGYEADDVLASIVYTYSLKGVPVTAFTTDKDAYQLFIYDGFEILDPKTKQLFLKEKVVEKFGVEAEDFIQYQAIVGDTADNIPGIKGFGAVAAKELIEKYKTLEGIYENISKIGLEEFNEGQKIPTAKLRTAENKQRKLLDSKDMAFKSRDLCTLETNLFENYPFDIVYFSPMPFVNFEKIVKSRLSEFDINY